MIATGMPARIAQPTPPIGDEKWIGKLASPSLLVSIGSALRRAVVQSSGSLSLNPGRSPLRLRIMM